LRVESEEAAQEARHLVDQGVGKRKLQSYAEASLPPEVNVEIPDGVRKKISLPRREEDSLIELFQERKTAIIEGGGIRTDAADY